jgi:hypothetical protein
MATGGMAAAFLAMKEVYRTNVFQSTRPKHIHRS